VKKSTNPAAYSRNVMEPFPKPGWFWESVEPVPKLIDYALMRMILGQALAVFQAKALQNYGI
jgi:hypothetical protein